MQIKRGRKASIARTAAAFGLQQERNLERARCLLWGSRSVIAGVRPCTGFPRNLGGTAAWTASGRSHDGYACVANLAGGGAGAGLRLHARPLHGVARGGARNHGGRTGRCPPPPTHPPPPTCGVYVGAACHPQPRGTDVANEIRRGPCFEKTLMLWHVEVHSVLINNNMRRQSIKCSVYACIQGALSLLKNPCTGWVTYRTTTRPLCRMSSLSKHGCMRTHIGQPVWKSHYKCHYLISNFNFVTQHLLASALKRLCQMRLPALCALATNKRLHARRQIVRGMVRTWHDRQIAAMIHRGLGGGRGGGGARRRPQPAPPVDGAGGSNHRCAVVRPSGDERHASTLAGTVRLRTKSHVQFAIQPFLSVCLAAGHVHTCIYKAVRSARTVPDGQLRSRSGENGE